MLKSIGTIQLALGSLLVVPAVTGQDSGARTLDEQLDATLSSLEYLAGLRTAVEGGDDAAMRALVAATEPARAASPQRAARMQTLRDELSRLRYSLDRLLSDPSEVAAITSLPPSVVRTLGLGGAAPTAPSATATAPTAIAPGETGDAGSTTADAAPHGGRSQPMLGPSSVASATGPGSGRGPVSVPDAAGTASSDVPAWSTGAAADPLAARPDLVAGTAPTTGLGDAMHSAISGEVLPLDGVSNASRRRGDEALALEGEGYVADPVRLGKLLVRADRPAEAIELLEGSADGPATRYWLARAYQAQDRLDEAVEIFAALASSERAGEYRRYAERDLKFLEFKRDFARRERQARSRR
ncbi:MAG: tetratricopeptide repeat protein [Planctomycetota bacterium]